MNVILSTLIIAALAVHRITSAFFDDGFGGTHFKVLFCARTVVMALAFALALNVLIGGEQHG